MLGPAHTQVVIESDEDYTPSGRESPIYQIVVTKTNASEVTIETLSGSSVVWPTGALIAGTKYDIYVKKITWAGTDASFIGFKLGERPFGLIID